jgi:hypothetical protein
MDSLLISNFQLILILYFPSSLWTTKNFREGTPSLIPPGDSACPEPNMVQGRVAGEVL